MKEESLNVKIYYKTKNAKQMRVILNGEHAMNCNLAVA